MSADRQLRYPHFVNLISRISLSLVLGSVHAVRAFRSPRCRTAQGVLAVVVRHGHILKLVTRDEILYHVAMGEKQGSLEAAIAPTVRARINRGGDRFWGPEDFQDLGNPNAVDQTLADLHAGGALRRIRRGLYWRGTHTVFGMAAPSASDIIRKITGLNHGIGPSGYSAALALGLSTQVPRRETFAVPVRMPTGLPDGIKVVSRAARRGRLDAKLRPQEVAWLEIAGSWSDHVSDWAEAEDRFLACIDSGEVRPDRLAAAARTESRSVKETIASLLRAAGRQQVAGVNRPNPAARFARVSGVS